MKKVEAIITMIIFCLILTVCSPAPGYSANVEISIGASVKFNSTEIEDAIECIKDEFLDFTDCELVNLWYDEATSNKKIESYLISGGGRDKNIGEENIIIFLSNFNTGSRAEMTMNQNSTYSHWQWILIRDSEAGEWTVAAFGY